MDEFDQDLNNDQALDFEDFDPADFDPNVFDPENLNQNDYDLQAFDLESADPQDLDPLDVQVQHLLQENFELPNGDSDEQDAEADDFEVPDALQHAYEAADDLFVQQSEDDEADDHLRQAPNDGEFETLDDNNDGQGEDFMHGVGGDPMEEDDDLPTYEDNAIDDDDEEGASNKPGGGGANNGGGIAIADQTLYTPYELLDIPEHQAWKLHPESRNMPWEELEHGREKGGRRITWVVDYEVLRKWIFFYCACERYGGPFGFMSNHYMCNFQVRDANGQLEAGGHVFTSMEQYYQWYKATEMAEATYKTFDYDDDRINNRQLPALILAEDNPNVSMALGRAFDCYESKDSTWWAEWYPTWEQKKLAVLIRGCQGKFGQNGKLAVKLMMTGDYNLIKASPKKKDTCGIGRAAREARHTFP